MIATSRLSVSRFSSWWGEQRNTARINPIGERLVAAKTYKQGDKHVLFGVVDGPLPIAVLLVLLGHQRQVGVLNVVVVEAAVQAGGGLVAVKAVLQVTRVAVEKKKTEQKRT